VNKTLTDLLEPLINPHLKYGSTQTPHFLVEKKIAQFENKIYISIWLHQVPIELHFKANFKYKEELFMDFVLKRRNQILQINCFVYV
jgi:hypothetical protein